MIPPDLASRLRLVAQDLPAAPQPVTPSRQLNDALSELSAGQRVMAEIQALLPNGMYRAVVAQREMTLALPFSAKPGDTLELEVQESDGKLSLAFVADRTSTESAEKANESVSTTLSKAGNLIGSLLNEVDLQGGRAKPASLNANQPLVVDFPKNPADLAPILKESLAKSGMFYEAHQARWIEGKLSTATLLQEPQGKLSSLIQQPVPGLLAGQPAHIGTPALSPSGNELAQGTGVPGISNELAGKPADIRVSSGENASQLPAANQEANIQRSGSPIHPDLTPIVQQQLNALATQNYVWQGQVWPGQPMHWEISEEGGGQQSTDDVPVTRWQTRLRLDLPALGGVEATLRLDPTGTLELSMVTENAASQGKLQAAGVSLNQSLEAAGLQLSKFAVNHGEISR